jgi:hypothetical protein
MAYKKWYKISIENKVYRISAFRYLLLREMDVTTEKQKEERDNFLNEIEKKGKIIMQIDSAYNY